MLSRVYFRPVSVIAAAMLENRYQCRPEPVLGCMSVVVRSMSVAGALDAAREITGRLGTDHALRPPPPGQEVPA